MDEIDQCAEGQGPHARARYDPYNRPVPSEDQESLDEVDRPSIIMKPNTPRSEPDLIVSSEDEKVESGGDEEFKLNGNVERKKSDGSDFEIVDTPPKIDNNTLPYDGTDGPPTPSSPTKDLSEASTDGPFSQMFKKPTNLIQPRMERTDKEGIVTKFTTYYPKQPTMKPSGANNKNVNSDYFYDMDTFPRGRLTLINVKHFSRASGMADYPRHGTDKDADGLCALFLDLGFIVDRVDNPSKKEIMTILKGAANEDYSKMSCCACAMLSHGEEGIIYGTDGYVKIKEVTKLFRTRSLAGKPKFFLFQACQGNEYMDPLDSVDGPGGQRVSEEDIALTLPSEADFIYAYSTVPGYYSWRNSRKGSWFMESVVSIFRENAHKMDVLRMLTRVNATVAYRKSRTDDYTTDNKRQIASIITQMRKDFFLFPAYGPLV